MELRSLRRSGPSRRRPTVVFVQHVHQQHYVEELGWLGRIGCGPTRTLAAPLSLPPESVLHDFSVGAPRDDQRSWVAPEGIRVVYLGVEPLISDTSKAARPTLLYFGRLKRYKRLELLLDAIERSPGSTLEVAGDGDYRSAFEAEIDRRGLGDRVIMHGFVPEAEKGRPLRPRVVEYHDVLRRRLGSVRDGGGVVRDTERCAPRRRPRRGDRRWPHRRAGR